MHQAGEPPVCCVRTQPLLYGDSCWSCPLKGAVYRVWDWRGRARVVRTRGYWTAGSTTERIAQMDATTHEEET